MSEVSQRRKSQSPSPSRKSISKEEEERLKAVRSQALNSAKKRSAKSGDFFANYGYHVVIGGFILVCLIAVGATMFKKTSKLDKLPVFDSDEISTFNANTANSFQVGTNDQFEGWTLADAKLILNTQLTHKQSHQRCPTTESSTIIPDSYNFNDKYPSCDIPVYAQGNCSASYAISATSSISNRFCQQSEGKVDNTLSPQQLISCDQVHSMGCKGGYISRSFDVAKKQGLVSSQCWKSYAANDYSDDSYCSYGDCEKFYIADYCVSSTEEGIKREIIENGPVVTMIPMYADFLIYKSGVYKVDEGTKRFNSGHAIKIVGWGISEDKTNYWIIENSWGESWGINGFAYIATGQKELQMEDWALAPIPSSAKVTDETTTEDATENDA